ncbi:BspA family leucine-rich repeat surface protein, partial [uncultured Fructobacillus sp.]
MLNKKIIPFLVLPVFVAGVYTTVPLPFTNSLAQADTATDVTNLTWGTAHATFNHETGALTVDGNGQLSANSFPVDKDSVKSININANVTLAPDASGTFANFSNITKITGLENVDTSQVTNMGFLFSADIKLETIAGLENWDVSKVTNFQFSFARTHQLNNLNLSQWNVSSATNMSHMFWEYAAYIVGRSWLQEADHNDAKTVLGGSLNVGGEFAKTTGQVTDMSYMFDGTVYQGQDGLASLPLIRGLYRIYGLSDLDTHSVTTMEYMFNGSFHLGNIDVSRFDTSNVQNFNNAFSYTLKNHRLDLSNFNTVGKSQSGFLASVDYGSQVVGKYEGKSISASYGLDTLVLGNQTILDSSAGLLDPTVGNPTFNANGKLVTHANWINLNTGETLTAAQLMDGQSHPGTWQWNTYSDPIATTQSKTVHETIHYQFADQKQAA